MGPVSALGSADRDEDPKVPAANSAVWADHAQKVLGYLQELGPITTAQLRAADQDSSRGKRLGHLFLDALCWAEMRGLVVHNESGKWDLVKKDTPQAAPSTPPVEAVPLISEIWPVPPGDLVPYETPITSVLVMQDPEQTWMHVHQAMKFMGMSATMLRRYVNDGSLTRRRIAKHSCAAYEYEVTALKKLKERLEAGKINAPTKALALGKETTRIRAVAMRPQAAKLVVAYPPEKVDVAPSDVPQVKAEDVEDAAMRGLVDDACNSLDDVRVLISMLDQAKLCGSTVKAGMLGAIADVRDVLGKLERKIREVVRA